MTFTSFGLSAQILTALQKWAIKHQINTNTPKNMLFIHSDVFMCGGRSSVPERYP